MSHGKGCWGGGSRVVWLLAPLAWLCVTIFKPPLAQSGTNVLCCSRLSTATAAANEISCAFTASHSTLLGWPKLLTTGTQTSASVCLSPGNNWRVVFGMPMLNRLLCTATGWFGGNESLASPQAHSWIVEKSSKSTLLQLSRPPALG